MTIEPFGMSTPPSEVSAVVTRHMFEVGVAWRRISSTAFGTRPGSRRIFSH